MEKRVNATQALIALGGKGKRLVAAGIPVPRCKSFIEVLGQPIFYWLLVCLNKGGVENLVVTSDDETKLDIAEVILDTVPHLNLKKVVFNTDPGLGTTGLPYQNRGSLEGDFFFVSGHQIIKPEHLIKMRGAKTNNNIVLTSYKTANPDRKHSINLKGRRVVVDAPELIDQNYIDTSLEMDFDPSKILTRLSAENRLVTVDADFPIEIDEPEEFTQTILEYMKFIPQISEYNQE